MNSLSQNTDETMDAADDGIAAEKRLSQSDQRFIRQRKLARRLAMQYLFRVDTNGEWEWNEDSFALTALTASLMEEEEEDAPLRSDYNAAKSFALRIAKGTIQHVSEIDMALENAAQNWTIARMSQIDRAILRIAAYELMFEEKIPAATSINEAVELSKAFGEAKSPRFINGVLDKVRENCGKTGRKTPKRKE